MPIHQWYGCVLNTVYTHFTRKLRMEEEDEGQRKVQHGFPNITLLVQRKANQTDLTTMLQKSKSLDLLNNR